MDMKKMMYCIECDTPTLIDFNDESIQCYDCIFEWRDLMLEENGMFD